MNKRFCEGVRVFCFIGLMMIPMHALYAIEQVRLQRGAFTFMRYCSGCHALKYMRFSRMTNDLNLSKKQAFHYSLQSTLPKSDAMHWFGQMPPDLSLIARTRSPDWIKAYLTGFYPDKTRPFGVNNTLVPDNLMPNVLAPLQEQVKKGEMTQQELDDTLQDVVSFLTYVAEPASLIRYRIGVFVIIFLFVFGFMFYLLRRCISPGASGSLPLS